MLKLWRMFSFKSGAKGTTLEGGSTSEGGRELLLLRMEKQIFRNRNE